MYALIFFTAFTASFTALLAIILPYFQIEDTRERLHLRSSMNRREQTGRKNNQKLRARISRIVDRLDLKAKLADEKTYASLRAAGFRGDNPVYLFLFMRLMLPIAGLIIVSIVAITTNLLEGRGTMTKILVFLLGGYAGFYAPILYVKQITKNRMASIRAAWPDALDLAIICVEAGMTIEAAFRKVSDEIGLQSTALAQELAMMVAELGVFPDRRKAYENFIARVTIEPVRPVAQALIQAERYGTPVGQALRTLSKEAREARVMEAERKAAALPPKLTVPMIVFFLPVLFALIIGPAVIRLTQ